MNTVTAHARRQAAQQAARQAAQTEAAPGTETVPGTGRAPGPLRWRSSSYSNAEGGNCVEVAHRAPGAAAPRSVPVRDGKRPHGPALLFGASAWSSFVAALKAPGARGI